MLSVKNLFEEKTITIYYSTITRDRQPAPDQNYITFSHIKTAVTKLHYELQTKHSVCTVNDTRYLYTIHDLTHQAMTLTFCRSIFMNTGELKNIGGMKWDEKSPTG